jgi:hypothetical protein
VVQVIRRARHGVAVPAYGAGAANQVRTKQRQFTGSGRTRSACSRRDRPIVQMRTNPLSGYGLTKAYQEPRAVFPRMDGVGTPMWGRAVLSGRMFDA